MSLWFESRLSYSTCLTAGAFFCAQILKGGVADAMQSAIKAGYSEKYAKSSSAKMLENVGIKSYIDAKMAEIESHKIADVTDQARVI